MTSIPSRKLRLLESLRAKVGRDLETLVTRQEEVRKGATHEENRAEHSKDTRATEQSYLARGLADRAEDLQRTADALAQLDLGEFGSLDPVAVSALVRLVDDTEDANEESWFVVPVAGGVELDLDSRVVRTVTPAAPLGRALLGLRAGQAGTIRTPRGERGFAILEIE